MTHCICMILSFKYSDFDSFKVGVDKTNGRYGDVSIKTCKKCNRKWLHYYVTYEGFSGSGRWYQGLLSEDIIKTVTPETAVEILESMDWYFYGGSYLGTAGNKGSGLISVDM